MSFIFGASIARRMLPVKGLYPVRAGCVDARNIEARAALLMITVPRRIS
jgi:hypothetical protein